MKKQQEIKITGEHGNNIILKFKPQKDSETEEKIMRSLIEIYEYRINVNNRRSIVNC